MDFAGKLNCLMNLTGTSNSKLARAVAVDASLVSRWRSGSRSPLGNQDMLAELGDFFTQRISMSYQKAELRLIMGDLYAKCSHFLPLNEILTLWLKGSAATIYENVGAVLLGEGLNYAEKMALLLHTAAGTNANPVLWLFLNLPAYKTYKILQDFFEFLSLYTAEDEIKAELNLILPGDVFGKIAGESFVKNIEQNSNIKFSVNGYETYGAGTFFETAAFAVEDVGGIVYNGIEFSSDSFNKIYTGSKLKKLVAGLKNIAAGARKRFGGSSGTNFEKWALQDFLTVFNDLKIGTLIKPEALFVSDSGGIGCYIKGDSEKLWGMPHDGMLGRSALDLERSGSYYPSITRMVLESGSSVCTMQTTGTGCELLVIGMPLLDANGKIEYIVNLSSEIKNKNQG